MAEPAMEEALDIDTELLPCGICGRTFLPPSLAKHSGICEKNATKKRKVFDSLKQRVEGTDLAIFHQKRYLKKQDSTNSQPEVKESNWKQKHIDLVNAIRAAKGVSTTMSPIQKKSSSSVISVGHERCPSCDRHFGPKAYDRHVEWCKERKNRIQQSPANVLLAKERLEARTKYRVPPLNKPKRLTTREKYSPSANRTENLTPFNSKSAVTIPLERGPSIRKPKSTINISKPLKETPNKQDKKENLKKDHEKNVPKEVRKMSENNVKNYQIRTKLPKINTIDVNKSVEGMQVTKLHTDKESTTKLVTWKDTVKSKIATSNLPLVKNKKPSKVKKLNDTQLYTDVLSNSCANLGSDNWEGNTLTSGDNNKNINIPKKGSDDCYVETMKDKSNRSKTQERNISKCHESEICDNAIKLKQLKTKIYVPSKNLNECCNSDNNQITLIKLYDKPNVKETYETVPVTTESEILMFQDNFEEDSLESNSARDEFALTHKAESNESDDYSEEFIEVGYNNKPHDEIIIEETKKLLERKLLTSPKGHVNRKKSLYTDMVELDPIQQCPRVTPRTCDFQKTSNEQHLTEEELLYSKIISEMSEIESLDGQVVNNHNDALSAARSQIYTIRKCHSDICLKKKSDANALTLTELDLTKFNFNYDDSSPDDILYTKQNLLDISAGDFIGNVNTNVYCLNKITYNVVEDLVPRKKRKLNDSSEERIYIKDELSHQYINNKYDVEVKQIKEPNQTNDISVIPLDTMINLLGICDKPTNSYLPVIEEVSNECTSVNDSSTTLKKCGNGNGNFQMKSSEIVHNTILENKKQQIVDDKNESCNEANGDTKYSKPKEDNSLSCEINTNFESCYNNMSPILSSNHSDADNKSISKKDETIKECVTENEETLQEQYLELSEEINMINSKSTLPERYCNTTPRKKEGRLRRRKIKTKSKTVDLSLTSFNRTLDIDKKQNEQICYMMPNIILNNDSDTSEMSKTSLSDNGNDLISPRMYEFLCNILQEDSKTETAEEKLLCTRSQIITLLKLNYKKIAKLIDNNGNSSMDNIQDCIKKSVRQITKLPKIVTSSNSLSYEDTYSNDRVKFPAIVTDRKQTYNKKSAFVMQNENNENEKADLHKSSVLSLTNLDYNPFISAERQLMELLECDDFKPFKTTQKPMLPTRPQTTDNISQKPKSPLINKNKKLATKSADKSHKQKINLTKITPQGKRASVIDPPVDFQDKSINDSFEMLENFINKTFGNNDDDFDNFIKDNRKETNGFFLEDKENDNYALSSILNDDSSIDPRLINENDNLTIPENLKSNQSSPLSDVNEVDHYSVQYDKKISVLENDISPKHLNYMNDEHLQTDELENLITSLDDLENFTKTHLNQTNAKLSKSITNKKSQKSTINLNSSTGAISNDKKKNLSSLKRSISLLDPVLKPKSLRNKKDVEEYFEEQENRNHKKESVKKQQSMVEEITKVQPKAEELFSVDDEMYEEYKKYEQMYLKEKEEKLKQEERRMNETLSEDDDGQPVMSTKLSGDSAYGSLNRKSPKIRSRAHKLSPLGIKKSPAICMESPTSSGSESSPAFSFSTPVSMQRMSKFCHECGNKYPVNTAKFCVECGVKRLLL